MKRITQVKILGMLWISPFLLCVVPFTLVTITLDKAADLFRWMHGWADLACEKASNLLFPPKWWPSHKYHDELTLIRAEIRRKRADELHE